MTVRMLQRCTLNPPKAQPPILPNCPNVRAGLDDRCNQHKTSLLSKNIPSRRVTEGLRFCPLLCAGLPTPHRFVVRGSPDPAPLSVVRGSPDPAPCLDRRSPVHASATCNGRPSGQNAWLGQETGHNRIQNAWLGQETGHNRIQNAWLGQETGHNRVLDCTHSSNERCNPHKTSPSQPDASARDCPRTPPSGPAYRSCHGAESDLSLRR